MGLGHKGNETQYAILRGLFEQAQGDARRGGSRRALLEVALLDYLHRLGARHWTTARNLAKLAGAVAGAAGRKGEE